MDLAPLAGIPVGVALAAACGFRVFVPLLALAIAGRTGTLALAPGFAWLTTDAALLAFATATLVEIAAYHVPLLDHLLDALAAPGAVLAGTIASAAVLVDQPPLLRWTLAVVAGGGAAGVVQAATTLSRVGSAALTGGLGNPVVATVELVAAVGTVALALTVPVLALVLVAMLCAAIVRASRRTLGRRRRPAAGVAPPR